MEYPDTYLDGKLHSFNDMPAISYICGAKYWYKNGVLHRDNGPAIILYSGYAAWFIDGVKIGSCRGYIPLNKTIKSARK